MANKFTFGAATFGNNKTFGNGGQKRETGYGISRAPSVVPEDLDREEQEVYRSRYKEIYNDGLKNYDEAAVGAEDALFSFRDERKNKVANAAIKPDKMIGGWNLNGQAGTKPTLNPELIEDPGDAEVYRKAYMDTYRAEENNAVMAPNAAMDAAALSGEYALKVKYGYANPKTVTSSDYASGVLRSIDELEKYQQEQAAQKTANQGPADAAFAAAMQERLEREQRDRDDAATGAGARVQQIVAEKELERSLADGSIRDANLREQAESDLAMLRQNNQEGRIYNQDGMAGLWSTIDAIRNQPADVNGNVDVSNRKRIPGQTMRAAGYDFDDGSYATLYSSTINGNGKTVLATPIDADGNVYSQEDLENYVHLLLDSTGSVEDLINRDKIENGGRGLIISGVNGERKNNIDALNRLGERLHEEEAEKGQDRRQAEKPLEGDTSNQNIWRTIQAMERYQEEAGGLAPGEQESINQDRALLEAYLRGEASSTGARNDVVRVLQAWKDDTTNVTRQELENRMLQLPRESVGYEQAHQELGQMVLDGRMDWRDLSNIYYDIEQKKRAQAEQYGMDTDEGVRALKEAAAISGERDMLIDQNTMTLGEIGAAQQAIGWGLVDAFTGGMEGSSADKFWALSDIAGLLHLDDLSRRASVALTRLLKGDKAAELASGLLGMTDPVTGALRKTAQGFDQSAAKYQEQASGELELIKPDVHNVIRSLGVDEGMANRLTDDIVTGLQDAAQNMGGQYDSMVLGYLTMGGFMGETKGATGFIGKCAEVLREASAWPTIINEIGEATKEAYTKYGDQMTDWDRAIAIFTGFANGIIEHYETRLGSGVQSVMMSGHFPGLGEFLASMVTESGEEFKQKFVGDAGANVADWLSGRELTYSKMFSMDAEEKDALINAAEYLDIGKKTIISTALMNVGYGGINTYRSAVDHALNGTATQEEMQMAAEAAQVAMMEMETERQATTVETPTTEEQHDAFETAAAGGDKPVHTDVDPRAQAEVQKESPRGERPVMEADTPIRNEAAADRNRLDQQETDVRAAEQRMREAQAAETRAIIASGNQNVQAEERARLEQEAREAIARRQAAEAEYQRAQAAASAAVNNQNEQVAIRQQQEQQAADALLEEAAKKELRLRRAQEALERAEAAANQQNQQAKERKEAEKRAGIARRQLQRAQEAYNEAMKSVEDQDRQADERKAAEEAARNDIRQRNDLLQSELDQTNRNAQNVIFDQDRQVTERAQLEQDARTAEMRLREAQAAETQAIIASGDQSVQVEERARREQEARDAIARRQAAEEEYRRAQEAASAAVQDQKDQASERQEREQIEQDQRNDEARTQAGREAAEQEAQAQEEQAAERGEAEDQAKQNRRNAEARTQVGREAAEQAAQAQEDQAKERGEAEDQARQKRSNAEARNQAAREAAEQVAQAQEDQAAVRGETEDQAKQNRSNAEARTQAGREAAEQAAQAQTAQAAIRREAEKTTEENSAVEAPAAPQTQEEPVSQVEGSREEVGGNTSEQNGEVSAQQTVQETEQQTAQETAQQPAQETAQETAQQTAQETEQEQERRRTADDINRRYGFNQRKADGDKTKYQPGLTVNTWDGDVDEQTRTELQVIHEYAREHGFSVVMDSTIRPDGVKGVVNGYYSRYEDGGLVIHLAQDGKAPLRTTLGHELYHLISNLNRNGAQRIEKLYRDFAGRQGVDIEALVTKKLEAYRNMGVIAKDDNSARARAMALEEVIADGMYDVIGDERTLRVLAMEDRGTAERIRDWAERVLRDIRRMIDKYGANKAEARVLQDQADAMENMRDAIERALAETKELQDAKKAAKSLGSNSEMMNDWHRAMDAATTREEMNAATQALAVEVLAKGGIDQNMDNVRTLLTASLEYASGGGVISQVLHEYGMNTWIPSEEANRAFVSMGKYMKQMLESQDEAGYAQLMGWDEQAMYSASPEQSERDKAYQQAVENGDVEEQQKMVDQAARDAGYNVHAYHGTSRGDRVGTVFLPERATSGPMAFFTDSKEIAENYARDKKDTSIAYDERYESYETQFRATKNGKDESLIDLWKKLPASAKASIMQKAGHVTFDYDADDGTVIYDQNTKEGLGNLPWAAREAKGNYLQALVEEWLNSGNLYNEEGKFLQVLELAGVNDALKKAGYSAPVYFNPDETHEKVYDVYMKINHPYNTSKDFNQAFIDDLQAWWDEQDHNQYERESNSADAWDKNDFAFDTWIEKAKADLERGTSHVWTVVPDYVTDYLKEKGYDGIQDTGGKNGGDTHTVWIPFSSEQVKDTAPVTYDEVGNVIPLSERFNEHNKDIRWSATQDTEESDHVRYAMDADDARDMTDLGSDIARTSNVGWQLIDTLRQMKMRQTQDADGNVQRTTGYWKKQTAEIAKSLTEFTFGKDQKTIEKAVRELFTDLDEYEGDARGFVDYALRKAQGTMRDLYTDETENPTRENLKAFFEKYGSLYITPEQKKELQFYAGGMTAFRRQAAGLVPITNKKSAIGLEEVWEELAPLIGKDPSIVSVGTMIMEFNDAVEKARSVNGEERTLTDEEMAVLDRRALDLVAEYMEAGATVVPTRTVEKIDADRHQQALKEVSRLQEETDKQQEEIGRLTRRLEDADNVNQSLNRQLFSRAAELDELKKSNATRAEIDQARTAYREAAAQADEAVKAMKDLQKKLEAARAKRDEYRSQLRQANRAEQQFEKAQHQIERLKAGRENLKKQIEQMKLKAMDARLINRQTKERNQHLNNIRKTGGALRAMFASPSEKKGYIPMDQVRVAADLVESLVDADKGGNAAKMSKRLENALRDARESTDYQTSTMYDEALYRDMQDVTRLLEDKGSLRNLSGSELAFVDGTLTSIVHQIKTSNETVGRQKNQAIQEEAEDAVKVMRENPKDLNGLGRMIRKGMLTHLNPQRFYAILGHHGNNAWTRMGEEQSEGQRKANMLTMNMTKTFEGLTRGENEKKFDKFTGKNATWYDTGIQILTETGQDSGRTWKMNGAMRAFFGLSWQSEENREAMRAVGEKGDGGKTLYQLTIPDEELMKKGKEKEAYARGERVYFTAEQAEQIIDDMTDYEKAWMNAWKNMEKLSKNAINETSLLLNGYRKANVNNYVPIFRDPRYTGKEFDTVVTDARLTSRGFLQERVNAHNPMMLMDLTNVINRQVRDVSAYYGFAIPTRNATRIYNGKMPGNVTSVKEEIYKTQGMEYAHYFEKLMGDLQGGSRVESSFLDRLRGTMAAATLSVNPTVRIKQAASYPTAAAVLGWKPILKAMKYANPVFLKNFNPETEIDPYTSAHWERRSQNLSDLEANAHRNTKAGKFYHYLTNGIQRTDISTTAVIWMACGEYVAENQPELKKGSAEFKQAQARIYEKALEQTQPEYGLMQAPQIKRNTNQLVKQFTMYTTQSMQNFGILVDAVTNLSDKAKAAKANNSAENQEALRQAKIGMARATSSLVTGAVILGVMTALGQMLKHKMGGYRDDKGDLTAESVSNQIFKDSVSSLAGMVVGGSEAFDFFNGLIEGKSPFDIEAASASMINDMYQNLWTLGNSISVIADSEKTPEQKLQTLLPKLRKLGLSVTQLYGVPAGNILNLIDGIAANAADFATGQAGTFASKSPLQIAGTALIGSAQGRETSNKAVAGYIAQEMMEGNQAEAVRLYNEQLRQGKTADALNTAIATWQKENIPQIREAAEAIEWGDLAGYNALINDLVSMGLSMSNAVKYVEAERGKMQKTDDNQETTRSSEPMTYEDIVSGMTKTESDLQYTNGQMNSLLEYGDIEQAKAIRDEMLKAGKKSSSINSSLTSHWKPLLQEAYANGDMEEVRRITNMLVQMGMKRTTITGWTSSTKSTSSSSSKKSGFGNGSFGSGGFGSSKKSSSSKKKSGFGSGSFGSGGFGSSKKSSSSKKKSGFGSGSFGSGGFGR